MKWPQISGVPTCCPGMIHITCMWNRKAGWGIPVFQWTSLCCYSTDKANEAWPRLSRPPLFSTPLSRGRSFIHAMFFCHCHDPISFENCVSQIAERAAAGTRAFKRNCPLEFNYVCCWVLLQKVLCQEFLIMLCFLPTGLQVWATGFELVECRAGPGIKNADSFFNMETQHFQKRKRWRGVSRVISPHMLSIK